MTAKYHRSVFVDGVSCATTKKEQVLAQLREHLTSHLLVVPGRRGNRYLAQSTGIPQGSVLSSLLCNLYYGSMQQRLFGQDRLTYKASDDDASLLVRMIDDFMLVSTNGDNVQSFLTTMYKGDPALGVQINKDKTKVNSHVSVNDEGKTEDLQPTVIDGGVAWTYFAWCGMLFNCSTGEVRIDYSRFLDSNAGSSLTVDRTRSTGEQLPVQMKMFVRPRCIPILFDSLINSRGNQMVNFYQLMVLGAVKTVEYLQSSDAGSTLCMNLPFLLSSIESTSIYAFNLTSQRLRQHGGRFGLCRQLATRLGWTAFYHVCSYHEDVRCLSEKLAMDSLLVDDHQRLRCTTSVLLSSYYGRCAFKS